MLKISVLDLSGLCMEALKNIQSTVEGILESCGIKLNNTGKVLVCIYRPPAGKSFLNLLNELLYCVRIKIDIIIDLFQDLLACCNNMKYSVTVPTRITAYASTCLENFIITNEAACKVSMKNLNISDQVIELPMEKKKMKDNNILNYGR